MGGPSASAYDQGTVALVGGKTDDVRRLHEELASRSIRGDVCTVLQVLRAHPDETCATLDADGQTALHLAVRGGHLALCRELLTRGADVNAPDAWRRTSLHVACEEEHADIALELLFARAEVDALDVMQQTALHKAVRGSSVEVLKVLLEHGQATPTLTDGSLTTPLMLAAGAGKVDITAYLLSRDPRLADVQNESGWTALHLAAHGREMRKRSIKECKKGKFAQVVCSILDAKAAVDCLDEDRKTPLHRAAATGNTETAAELLRGGAEVIATDNCRWTPLHYACQEGHLECARLLLDAKAEVQREDAPCLTPLAVSTMECQVKIAELLMNYKADPNLHRKGVASPMMIARKDKQKYGEVLALFELGWINHEA